MDAIQIRKTFGTFSSRMSEGFTFWTALAPAGAAGIVTGVLASTVAWISQFGPFGWWVSGLLGFLTYATGQALIGVAKDRRAKARIRYNWAAINDAVNPLDQAFTKKRLVLSEIASPIDKRIRDKQFTDCELMGPANIFIMSGAIMNMGFTECDICVVRDNGMMGNVVVLENCTIIGGRIFGCTVFVLDSMFHQHFAAMGAQSISYRKNEQV